MHARLAVPLVAAVALVGLPGCLWDDEADGLRAEVAALTEEVEGLTATLGEVEDRHDRTAGATERVRLILHDPEAFGTPAEVAAQLAQMATEDAQMRDDVFGSVGIRTAWESTLFGSGSGPRLEARVDTVRSWLSEDGSMSGSLWVWHGTNESGHPFELAGVQVSTHDESGRATEIRVHYPYPAEHVMEAIDGEGTATGTLLTP